MVFQIAAARKCPVTNNTQIWLFSCMPSLMLVQNLLILERFMAQSAFVGSSLQCGFFHAGLENTYDISKRFVAQIALL